MKIADQGDAKDQDQKDEAKDVSEGRVATEREAKGERHGGACFLRVLFASSQKSLHVVHPSFNAIKVIVVICNLLRWTDQYVSVLYKTT